MSMKSVNPATGQVLQEYAVLGDADLETSLERAVSTQKELAELSVDRRAEWLLQAADGLRARREELARLMTAGSSGSTFMTMGWTPRRRVKLRAHSTVGVKATISPMPTMTTRTKQTQSPLQYQSRDCQ